MGIPEEKIVDYAEPPVVEVVCGVTFKAIKSLLAPHLGVFWDKIRTEYPECRELPILPALIEPMDEKTPNVQEQIEVTLIPPLPRVWFLDKKENTLIQVQRNRFVHNWKSVKKEDRYPDFKNIFEAFQKQLAAFTSFLRDEKLEELHPVQYELTYINHLLQGRGWEKVSNLGNLFPDFDWHCNPTRFLPEIEAINWNTSFLLPRKAGRLHIAMRSAIRKQDSFPVILLDLTARGIDPDRSQEMESWFALAHEWIVRGFTDITSKKAQETVWRRLR